MGEKAQVRGKKRAYNIAAVRTIEIYVAKENTKKGGTMEEGGQARGARCVAVVAY